jgi:hypothetical protein
MTPEQKRLADRVVKLLALANSTTFAAEAATARALAEQLMRAHQIAPAHGKPPRDTIEVRMHVPFAKGMRWECMIASALARLCSCELLFDTALTRYTLIGAIKDLDILQYMIAEIARQRIRVWLEHKAGGNPDSFGKFCYGFACALEEKIKQIVNLEAVAQTSKHLLDWFRANVGPIGNGMSLRMGNASSEAGIAAGRSASLHGGALGQPHKQIGHDRNR